MPYTAGLRAAVAAFLSVGFSIQLTIAALLLVIIFLISQEKPEPNDLVLLLCWSLFTITPFFCKRSDFLNWGFKAVGQSHQFKLLKSKHPRSLSAVQFAVD
jgi:hypothetical protein